MVKNKPQLPDLDDLSMEVAARLLSQELERREELQKLENDFSAFAQAAWHVVAPDRELVWNWHHDLICGYLAAFATREIRYLQINIPPRCTKSLLCSVLFPAWVWINNPSHQFLTLSHKEDLATRDAVGSRNLISSDWYQQRWSDRFQFSGDTNQKTRYQNNHSGHRIASGMTGQFLGDGGDCLPGETLIETEHGPERIDTLHRLLSKPKVLSYDHFLGKLEYRTIEATRELPPDNLIEFLTSTGQSLRTTRRHRLFSHQANYKSAEDIYAGEAFLETSKFGLVPSRITYVLKDVKSTDPVYDLQVEGNRNFFANKILSHNSIILDDPMNPEGAQSDVQRSTTLQSYDGQLISRMNDRRTGGVLIIMQRLHDQDNCGHVLSREGQYPDGRWHRLVLPMRYDPALSVSTYEPAGKDPRKTPGELLDPIRFPRDETDLLELTLGPYNVSGQHQQSPSPPGGGILKRSWWQEWPDGKPLPKCSEIFASLDTAFTEKHHKEMEKTGKSARSACTVWGVFKGELGKPGIILLGAWADWLDWPALVKKAEETYNKFDPDYMLIEKKASGISLVQDLRYHGIPVVDYTPDMDKIARAYACQSILSSGFVWYPNRQFALEVIDECAGFPRSSLKDYPDTCSQAWLRIKKSGLMRKQFDDPVDSQYDEIENLFERKTKSRRVVGIYG